MEVNSDESFEQIEFVLTCFQDKRVYVDNDTIIFLSYNSNLANATIVYPKYIGIIERMYKKYHSYIRNSSCANCVKKQKIIIQNKIGRMKLQ